MTTTVTHKEQPAANAPTPLPQRRRVLDSLPSQARTTGDQAAARSRMVKRLRLALPILALVLVAAFFFNTKSNDVDKAFLDDFKDVSASAEELRMANPRFAGVDNEGKPFEITANTAIQNTKIKDVVTLDKPRAVQGENNESTVVTADKGVYRSDINILELEDSVTLQHNVGAESYVFKSPSATVAIKDEVVTSDAGVGGEGTDGSTLQADHMKAYNSEGRVVFEGNVRMRIYPKSSPAPLEQQSAPEKPELRDSGNDTPQ
ncbi:LPS export ABC transporter periplasmic protein LptC [Hyphococcus luteus]|uniref:LPS export ABC transporter periplasmic protein LptC n=1 Tax=Hyphococcus luteus TaxID=2058213 RepID=A0A2S7KAC7_9PROT|nr:LPS export ABC transporter periplasmic protein LptC [Marinicaulis flavus]PQA89431.1 LPS export ABC transporter periplasmic protein LptC [Marinicaulis flavus]